LPPVSLFAQGHDDARDRYFLPQLELSFPPLTTCSLPAFVHKAAFSFSHLRLSSRNSSRIRLVFFPPPDQECFFFFDFRAATLILNCTPAPFNSASPRFAAFRRVPPYFTIPPFSLRDRQFLHVQRPCVCIFPSKLILVFPLFWVFDRPPAKTVFTFDFPPAWTSFWRHDSGAKFSSLLYPMLFVRPTCRTLFSCPFCFIIRFWLSDSRPRMYFSFIRWPRHLSARI